MAKGFIKKYLSEEQLRNIAGKIADAEQHTQGEIHVAIRHRRHWNERNLSLHEITQKEFFRIGMHKTRHRTGVLILLLFNERKFQIIADEGIHARVADGTWDRVAALITSHFKNGTFYEGICKAVEEVGSELQQHFPRLPDDSNEISNNVDIN